MALITNVMMGGVNNLSDARFAAGWEVDFLGFCLDDQDKRSISVDEVQEIANWIEGPALVAEFGYQDPATINSMLNKLGFEWVCLPGDYPEDPAALHGKVFRKLTLDKCNETDPAWSLMEQHAGTTAFYILEMSGKPENNEGLTRKEDISFLQKTCKNYPVFACLPVNAENVVPVIKQLNPAGIFLQGGDEVTPGYRDFDELIDLLEILEK